jgi:hypothetical protein
VTRKTGLKHMFDSIAFLVINRNGNVSIFHYDEMNEIKMLTYQITKEFGDIQLASSIVNMDGCRLAVSNYSQLAVLDLKLDLFEKGKIVLNSRLRANIRYLCT